MKKFLLAALLLALTACKQGEHDHCQVDEDCGDSYVCAQATSTCETPGGGSIDAEVPADTIVVIDSSVDAMPDAMPDAMLDAVPDAGPDGAVDAMPDAP